MRMFAIMLLLAKGLASNGLRAKVEMLDPYFDLNCHSSDLTEH